MKIESVSKINLHGEYEVLYMGKDRGIARQVYKENMIKKDEFLSLFHQSGYSSRTMSKTGHITHSSNKTSVIEEKPKRKRRKKISEE
jgi:hypothetical protein